MAEKIRVLYVDDESVLLEPCRIFLERSGTLTVTTAASAPDAIRLLEKEQFDVIVSDYQMPEMDGIEFLILVRAKFGQIPFILFTGKGREDMVIQAINSGADFYLQKGGEPSAQFAELSHKITSAVERKRAEDSLRTSEEKYRHLIEHSNEAIVVAQDMMLKLVNHRTIELTGYSEEELLSMPFSQLIHPDDRAMVMERHQKRLKGEKLSPRYSFRTNLKDGTLGWVEISAVAIDWDGRLATLNFLTDITERKRQEEALQRSEEKFRVIADYTVNWESWFGPDGKYIWVSPSVTGFTGYSSEEILAMPDFISTVIVEEDRPLFTERFREAIGGASGENFEFRYLHRNGTKHWLNVSWQPIVDRNGNSIGTRASGHDITERKRIEEDLQLHGQIVQNMAEGVVMVHAGDGRIMYANPRFERMFGYDPGELTGKDISTINAPKDRTPQTIAHEISSSLRKTGVWNGEVHNIRKDGTMFWCYANVSTVQHHIHGEIWIAVHEDITERKKAEDALRESDEKFKYISELIPDFAYSCTKEPGGGFAIDWITGTPEPITGYTTDEIREMTCWKFLVIDEDIPVFEKNVTRLLPGEFDRCELRVRRKDGGIIWMSSYTQCVTDPKEPENHRLYGACRDITKRKMVEEALRKSEEKYRQLVELAEEGIWAIDAENNTMYLNPRMAEMLQYTVDEMQGLPILSFMDDAGKMIFAQNMEGHRRGIAEVLPFEFITKGGSRIYATISASPLTDEKGAYKGSIAVISDITERKRAEEERSRLSAIVEHTDEAIISKTLDGIITSWNAGAERMYGYSAQEIVGKSISLLVPPDCLDDTLTILERVKNGDPVIRYETLRRKKDGGLIHVTLTASPIRDAYNRLIGTSIIGHDVTERKKAEEALQQANKQLNLLSSITRHDILNQLFALKGYIELSRDEIDNPTTLIEYIQKEETVARTIEHQITFTRDYQELGAAAPEWQSVNASITKAVAGLPMRDIHVEVDPKNPEVFADRLFEKVFYNLLDNALRYGGEQMKGSI